MQYNLYSFKNIALPRMLIASTPIEYLCWWVVESWVDHGAGRPLLSILWRSANSTFLEIKIPNKIALYLISMLMNTWNKAGLSLAMEIVDLHVYWPGAMYCHRTTQAAVETWTTLWRSEISIVRAAKRPTGFVEIASCIYFYQWIAHSYANACSLINLN